MTDQEKEYLVHLSSEEVRLLLPGHWLVLNLEDEIATLFDPSGARVLAQCQFPHYAFRALILLLKSPRGASFAEIYAACRCPDPVIRQVLAAPDASQSEEFQVHVRLWHQHLEQVAARGKKASIHELKAVRRAVREKRSVHTLGRAHGFGWRVRAQPRHGYQLLRAPVAHPPQSVRAAVAPGEARP